MKTNRLAGIVIATAFSVLGGHELLAQSTDIAALPESIGSSEELTPPTQGDLQELRKSLRTAKKQMIASHMELTDGEAERFWPVYDQFADELARISAWKFALTRDFVRHHRTLTDRQAETFLEQRIAIEQAGLQLRAKYVPLFRKVLSAKSTVLFYQIEWRLNLMIEIQWAADIPLVDPAVYDPASKVL